MKHLASISVQYTDWMVLPLFIGQ